jgi:4-hydroxy-L-threonine phosphate dehydrogenase PdxA
MEADRPLIAVTIGDPAGIGPEVVLGALASEPALYDVARPLVVGDRAVLARAAEALKLTLNLNPITQPAGGRYQRGVVDLLDLATPGIDRVRWGEVQALAGQAAYAYMRRAARSTPSRRRRSTKRRCSSAACPSSTTPACWASSPTRPIR